MFKFILKAIKAAILGAILALSFNFFHSHSGAIQSTINGLGVYGEVVSKAPIFHLDEIEKAWEKFTSYTPIAKAYNYFTEGDLLQDAKAKAVEVKDTVKGKFAIYDQDSCTRKDSKFYIEQGVITLCIHSDSKGGK